MTIEQLRDVVTALGEGLQKDVTNLRKHVRERLQSFGQELVLVKGDLSGIQTYLYNVNAAEDVDGGVAKRLRGRSFYLSAICHALADELVRQVGLDPYLHIMHATGGKFLVALPYSDKTTREVWRWKIEIEEWLWRETWGELYLNLAVLQSTLADLDGKFANVASRLQAQLDKGKYVKFASMLKNGVSMSTHSGTFRFPMFQVHHPEECHSCSCLPVESGAVKPNLCQQCNKFEDVGSYDEVPTHNFLDFGAGHAPTITGARVINFRNNHAVLRTTPATLPQVAGFIPQWRYQGIDLVQCTSSPVDEKLNLLCQHCSLFKLKPTDCDPDRLATRFHCLATLAQRRGGAPKIAVLAADGDDFSYHLNATPGITLEDQVVLSNLIYGFFCDHLIELLVQHDCLLVYSGGDDFVVVGPWANVIDVVNQLRRDFAKWTLNQLHFSAGIFITNPQEPIYESIRVAQRYLNEAKGGEGKDAVRVMETCIPWAKFDGVYDFAEELEAAERDGIITMGFIYGLYRVCEQFERYKHYDRIDGLRYLGWLASHIKRNLKLDWPGEASKTAQAQTVQRKLQELLDINSETLLPYLRFALDWTALRGRGE